jgi:hypothetical protein
MGETSSFDFVFSSERPARSDEVIDEQFGFYM